MRLPADNGVFNKDFTLLLIINFASHAGLQMFASVMSKYAVTLGFPALSFILMFSIGLMKKKNTHKDQVNIT